MGQIMPKMTSTVTGLLFSFKIDNFSQD